MSQETEKLVKNVLNGDDKSATEILRKILKKKISDRVKSQFEE